MPPDATARDENAIRLTRRNFFKAIFFEAATESLYAMVCSSKKSFTTSVSLITNRLSDISL